MNLDEFNYYNKLSSIKNNITDYNKHSEFIAVRKIPLNERCGVLDVCLDEYGSCQGSICLCDQAYFERNGVCVPKILLNRGCQGNDVCLDDNAFCQGGVCRCDPLYFEKNSACSKYSQLLLGPEKKKKTFETPNVRTKHGSPSK